jgi:hypothetical protein
VDVTVEPEDAGFLVKVQTHEWELNVHASQRDLDRLRDIRAAVWNEGRSIRAGTSAGESVFWAIDGNHASILIGHDDETWDVAITVPLAVVEEIVRQATEGTGGDPAPASA